MVFPFLMWIATLFTQKTLQDFRQATKSCESLPIRPDVIFENLFRAAKLHMPVGKKSLRFPVMCGKTGRDHSSIGQVYRKMRETIECGWRITAFVNNPGICYQEGFRGRLQHFHLSNTGFTLKQISIIRIIYSKGAVIPFDCRT